MNFIFVVSDSFRFDNLACYAGMRPRFATATRPVQTPHLDAFCRRCTIFDHAYFGSYPTIPNRKDIFTGRMRPFNAWAPLAAEERTFIADFVKAGYVTQIFTDTYHLMKDNFNFARDFDGWEWIRGQENDRLSCYAGDWPIDPAKCRTSTLLHATWRQQIGNLDYIGRQFEEQCFCAQTATKAIQWLERQYSRDNPFFLYIDSFDPHEPFDAPQWYEDLYDPGYTGDVNRFPKYGPSSIHTSAELNHIRALYAAEVTLVDRWIGRLLETIEHMGLMDNTCIVFTSDHGFYLGEHDSVGKIVQPLYEEICHLPLLIHMPGQQRSRRASAIVQPVDLTATLLDLARVNTDLMLDGVSLRPVLEGRRMQTRPYAFSRGSEQGLTVSSSEWSLVYPRPEEGKELGLPELFNLRADPMQKKNLLRSQIKVARAMWDAHQQWLRKASLEIDVKNCPRP